MSDEITFDKYPEDMSAGLIFIDGLSYENYLEIKQNENALLWRAILKIQEEVEDENI